LKIMLFNYSFDVGISLVGLITNAPYTLLIFVVIVLVEAGLLKDYLKLPFRKTFWYSLGINVASTVAGILFVFAAFYSQGYFGFTPIILYVISFLLTIAVEFVALFIILRKSNLVWGKTWG